MLTRTTLKSAVLLLAAALGPQSAALADGQPLYFNVLNQRSIALTARYWNPILGYVGQKSGVALELKLSKTTKENNAIAEKGAFHFLYTNHFFTPERDRLGYRVIARPVGPGIRAQIVARKDSPILSLKDLEGKDVAFASPDAFAAYWLPMDALMRAKVHVNTTFAGNQEAAFAQLSVSKVAAAGVNSTVMERYARREGLEYRVLWTSEIYNDLCIMANPKLPAETVAAVRDALVNMAKDPHGRKILEAGAELLKIEGDLGFVASSNRDYDNYRAFFKTTLVKDLTRDK